MTIKKRMAAAALAVMMAVSAVPASAENAAQNETTVSVAYLASSKTVMIAGKKYKTSITELYLPSEKLSKTDLENIGKLKKLKKLDLSGCSLKNLSFLKI